jgi:hypothetical protein
MWLDKPNIKYRFDIQHSIFFNGGRIGIENYSFNHQENEEWIELQKNIYLNLDSNPIPELYPEIWKTKESIRNYLNNKFSSGRIIKDSDIIYSGILINNITNVSNLIHFHIDELKSKNVLFEYSINNGENKSLLPNLRLSKLENDCMVELYYYEDCFNSVGDFKFYEDDFETSHAHSFRRYKMIKFGFPLLIDLPVDGNVKNDDIYESIGEKLKIDFINYLKENKTK